METTAGFGKDFGKIISTILPTRKAGFMQRVILASTDAKWAPSMQSEKESGLEKPIKLYEFFKGQLKFQQ